MTLADFESNLLLLGSDLDAWPDPAAAYALVASLPDAAALLEEHRQLDRDLRAAVAPGPAPLVRLVPQALKHQPLALWPGGFGKPALAASVAILICVAGYSAGHATSASRDHVDMALAALASGDLELLQKIQ